MLGLKFDSSSMGVTSPYLNGPMFVTKEGRIRAAAIVIVWCVCLRFFISNGINPNSCQRKLQFEEYIYNILLVTI